MLKIDKLLNNIKLQFVNLKYIGSKNKIILSKDNKYNDLEIKFSDKFIKSTNERDIEVLKEHIKKFLLILKTKCKNFNSDIFIKNFEKTIFNIENLSEELKPGVSGSVEVGYVNSFEINHFISTYHELMHLASIKNKDCDLGELYEWYTQFLTERYFGKEDVPSYVFGVKIMEAIETIFGQDYLEQIYFSGNFSLSSKKLFSGIGGRNSFSLFVYFNEILACEQGNNILNKKKEIQKSFNSIYKILFNYFKYNFDESLYDEKEIEEIKSKWCSDLIFKYRNQLLCFKTLESSEFDKMIEDIRIHKKRN